MAFTKDGFYTNILFSFSSRQQNTHEIARIEHTNKQTKHVKLLSENTYKCYTYNCSEPDNCVTLIILEPSTYHITTTGKNITTFDALLRSGNRLMETLDTFQTFDRLIRTIMVWWTSSAKHLPNTKTRCTGNKLFQIHSAGVRESSYLLGTVNVLLRFEAKTLDILANTHFGFSTMTLHAYRDDPSGHNSLRIELDIQIRTDKSSPFRIVFHIQ
ncbi:hypothetical protein AGLY_004927 [Aphis glycines]|uniref:Uncharacterized protein n=1 Tax=Aphis glycines TaxID=307491 RepID=A0A6G0TV92_APHGL|nr:hypothetical protein AGLY_004927 [Aphis glycines]